MTQHNYRSLIIVPYCMILSHLCVDNNYFISYCNYVERNKGALICSILKYTQNRFTRTDTAKDKHGKNSRFVHFFFPRQRLLQSRYSVQKLLGLALIPLISL